MKPKTNRRGRTNRSSSYDQCQTPEEGLIPLLPFLRSYWHIWEPARGEGNLMLSLLTNGFYNVVGTDILTGQDFFTYRESDFDAIVTNPPYSVKYQWLKRCYELGKPFALLMPVEMLGAKTAQRMFAKHGISVVFPYGRINFKMPNKGWDGSSAQFPTAWYTWKMTPPGVMIFSSEARSEYDQNT